MSESAAAPRLAGEPRILSFEGLRGLLALTVCAGHLGLNSVTERLGFHVRFELAVELFFVVSGFVLARAYYFQRRSFRQLLCGRVARLYPLHLLTLAWCVGLDLFQRKSLDPVIVLQNLFLVQNIGLPPNRWAFNFPSWSISVEMAVSLLFYVVMFRRSQMLSSALAAAGVFGIAISSAPHLDAAGNLLGFLNVGLLGGVSGFCLGSAACLVTENPPRALTRLGWATPALLAITAVFFVLPVWSWGIGAVFAICATVAVVSSAVNDTESLLSARPLVYLGAVSYSIYLLHIPVLLTAEALFSADGIRGLMAKTLILVAILLASAACHRFFELPMQRRVLTWLAPRGRRPAGRIITPL